MWHQGCFLRRRANLGGIMSSLQEMTLKQFMKAVGKKTLQQYSDLTGIEKTRIFRLLNGAEMKLGEFEVLQSFLNQNHQEVKDWKKLLSEAEIAQQFQKDQAKMEASILIERSERLKEYLTNQKMAA